MSLLEIQGLEVGFDTARGRRQALFGVDLSLKEGEILALVGESGSGKTLTGLSILNLLEPPAVTMAGQIFFRDQDVFRMSEKELLTFRGGQAAMIFQEPMTALNPVFSVGFQIGEVLRTHLGLDRKQTQRRSLELLRRVGIPEPEIRLKQYPFQLSGGMRQRVMIAMALAASPKLLIADEPTTALDVTIQAQILNLIRELNTKDKMAVLLISHDLGIVAQASHRVAIMYAGRIVEMGETAEVLNHPRHPYTIGLLNSLPGVKGRRARLTPIPGQVPSLGEFPTGCPFRDRCSQAKAACENDPPVRQATKKSHWYRCVT